MPTKDTTCPEVGCGDGRKCLNCGAPITRKLLASGRPESPSKFRRRKTCGQTCGQRYRYGARLRRHPPPPAGGTDGRKCKACGRPLVRKQWRNTPESSNRFRARETCGRSCAMLVRHNATPNPKPRDAPARRKPQPAQARASPKPAPRPAWVPPTPPQKTTHKPTARPLTPETARPPARPPAPPHPRNTKPVNERVLRFLRDHKGQRFTPEEIARATRSCPNETRAALERHHQERRVMRLGGNHKHAPAKYQNPF